MKRLKSRMDLWRQMPFFGVLSDIGSFVLFAVRRFNSDRMGVAAGALTYSTLLALVPLLVIAFAVLSGFPAFDSVRIEMQEMLHNALVPEVGADVRTYLAEFTRNAGNLTTVGIVALALTAVLLLSTIEDTLNRIWRVQRSRPIAMRFLVYWTILTLGPMLLGVSFTLTSDLSADVMRWAREAANVEVIEVSSTFLSTLLAILTQSAAFTLLFTLVPARRVRLRDGALGGIIAGVAFGLLRWGFNTFLTSGSTYTTIYGAVAIFPIFLLWIYLSWTAIIFGAVFAASFPDWWRSRDPQIGQHRLPGRRLEVAVAVLAELSRQSQLGGAVSQDRLAESVPLEIRDEMIDALRAARYIVNTEDERLSLGRDLHAVSVAKLAREIGLALGLAQPASRGEQAAEAQVLPKIERATGVLPGLLARLSEAEDEILDMTVAGVIAGQSEATGLPRAAGTTSANLRKTQ